MFSPSNACNKLASGEVGPRTCRLSSVLTGRGTHRNPPMGIVIPRSSHKHFAFQSEPVDRGGVRSTSGMQDRPDVAYSDHFRTVSAMLNDPRCPCPHPLGVPLLRAATRPRLFSCPSGAQGQMFFFTDPLRGMGSSPRQPKRMLVGKTPNARGTPLLLGLPVCGNGMKERRAPDTLLTTQC